MSDLISREEVLRTIITAGEVEPDMGYTHLYKVIENLPSADRPTGEWIKSNLLPHGWHCSHCDAPVMTDDIEEMLFCPNCGAEMG